MKIKAGAVAVRGADAKSCARPMNEAAVAERLNADYAECGKRWKETLNACIRFGTELVQWERFLGESRHYGNAGEGLKTWLAEHCPGINYNTAMGYKALAAKAVHRLGGSAEAVAALLGAETVTDPAGEVIDVSDDMKEKAAGLLAEAKSRRQFEQMYFEWMRKVGADDTEKPTAKPEKPTPEAAAAATLYGYVRPISKHWGSIRNALALCPAAKLADALSVFEKMAFMIKQEMEARG